jgi:hypothetical protein
MKVGTYLCALLVCLSGSGCQLYWLATQNLYEAAADSVDECAMRRRHRKLAEDAWQDVVVGNPGAAYSPAYAQGFKDGFTQTLAEGGRSIPPVVPPWSYRRTKYQTPAGYQAIEDWYAGFSHGTAAAVAWAPPFLKTLPSSGAELKGSRSPPRQSAPPGESAPDSAEILPHPKRVALPPTGQD